MHILIFPIFLLPIVSVVIWGNYKSQYNRTTDPEEKMKLKKKVKIAFIVNIIAMILLALLIALFVVWLFALKNMT